MYFLVGEHENLKQKVLQLTNKHTSVKQSTTQQLKGTNY